MYGRMPPVKNALAYGVVVMDPEPLIFGISKKLTGRFSEERRIFWKIILIWYCSRILAYFADIWLKSGAVVEPQPLRAADRVIAGSALRTKKRKFIFKLIKFSLA